MKQWQVTEASWNLLAQALNELQRDGWQVFHVLPHGDEGHYFLVVSFKVL